MRKQGLFYAISAYCLWGMFPLYWAYLKHINSVEVLFHRMVWAFFFVVALVQITRGWKWLRPAIKDKRMLAAAFAAAIIIAFNWGVYIFAVSNEQVVDASLGYYINPLVSVVFGVVLFKETLRPLQWLAVCIATAGVLYMVIAIGKLPWVSLALAFTFSIYGVIKKSVPLGAFEGMALETGLLVLPASAFLLYWSCTGEGAFGTQGITLDALLIFSGLLTLIPLLLFAAAATRLPLTLVGIIQYLAPTIQLMVGVIILGEPFSPIELVGFTVIWIALAVFAIDGVITSKKQVT